jgi:hypothetical protein
MEMQTSSKDNFASNFWIQMAALGIVVVVVIAVAAKYVW